MGDDDDRTIGRSTRVLAIEGNVGVGKSTVLAELAARSDLIVVPEPVAGWAEHIANMYCGGPGDGSDWCLPMQMLSITTRIEAMLAAVRAADADPAIHTIVVERSNQSASLFGRATLTEEEMRAFELVRDRYDQIPKCAPPDAVVYLRASPETCSERIGRRNRRGEDAIDMGLLRTMHELHDETFLVSADLVVDTSVDRAEDVCAKIVRLHRSTRR